MTMAQNVKSTCHCHDRGHKTIDDPVKRKRPLILFLCNFTGLAREEFRERCRKAIDGTTAACDKNNWHDLRVLVRKNYGNIHEHR